MVKEVLGYVVTDVHLETDKSVTLCKLPERRIPIATGCTTGAEVVRKTCYHESFPRDQPEEFGGQKDCKGCFLHFRGLTLKLATFRDQRFLWQMPCLEHQVVKYSESLKKNNRS